MKASVVAVIAGALVLTGCANRVNASQETTVKAVSPSGQTACQDISNHNLLLLAQGGVAVVAAGHGPADFTAVIGEMQADASAAPSSLAGNIQKVVVVLQQIQSGAKVAAGSADVGVYSVAYQCGQLGVPITLGS